MTRLRPNAPASIRGAATPEELAFATMFGLALKQASILARMFHGEAVHCMRMNICRLRRALDSEAIDTTSAGYALTDTGRQECADALQEFRGWVTGRAA